MKTLAHLPLGLALCLTLAACSSGPEQRFAVPPVAPEARVPVSYGSIEVRDITLPTYALSEEIFVETADGALTSSGLLWADDPSRAATLELTRALSTITGARIASEPWPFSGYADARLEVRIEEFIASAEGEFRIAGQYFVAPEEGQGRDRAGDFRITVPLRTTAEGVADIGPAAIAEARARAMTELATGIAEDGLR